MPDTIAAPKPAPTPEQLTVLANVNSYALSEFDDRVLAYLRDVDERHELAGRVDGELYAAGLRQPSAPPPLDDAQAGRLFRAAVDQLQLGEWMVRDAREALDMILALSSREGFASGAEERGYNRDMAAWFEENAGFYRRSERRVEGP